MSPERGRWILLKFNALEENRAVWRGMSRDKLAGTAAAGLPLKRLAGGIVSLDESAALFHATPSPCLGLSYHARDGY
jgi:hypothetical protein